MPSDGTRRLLKIFGVAVTSYEDLIQNGAAAEEIKQAETEVFDRFTEIKNHIERLRAGAKAAS
jgi:hypothetical protein